jgi:hypothetical protein
MGVNARLADLEKRVRLVQDRELEVVFMDLGDAEPPPTPGVRRLLVVFHPAPRWPDDPLFDATRPAPE